MNKLETIDRYLKRKEDLFVHMLDDKFYACYPGSYVTHSVTYLIAPKSGLIDSVPELQHFMMRLIPKGLKPSHKHDFSQDDIDIWIRGGYLFFNELIGYEKIQMKWISMDPYLGKHGFKDGKRLFEICNNMIRRVEVYPFPSKEYLNDQLSDGLYIMTGPPSFHPHNLAKYKKD